MQKSNNSLESLPGALSRVLHFTRQLLDRVLCLKEIADKEKLDPAAKKEVHRLIRDVRKKVLGLHAATSRLDTYKGNLETLIKGGCADGVKRFAVG